MVKSIGRVTPRHPLVSLFRQYALLQIIVNPLVAGAAAFALAPNEHARVFVLSLTIAVVASSVACVPVAFALALDHRRQRRGEPARRYARARYLGLALASLPLGLVLAGRTTLLMFGVRLPDTAFDYRLGTVLGTLLALVFFLWQTSNEARRAALTAQLERAQAERHELEAKLHGLTAQLNPHLLFNALNTVAALIQDEPQRAEATLLRLADLYRGVLAATRKTEHTLGEELAICRAYLDVEQARFGDRLAVEVDVDPELEPSRMPVLLLQPLVENAINHGLASRAGGGRLRVAARRTEHGLELSVVDDGIGLGGSGRRGLGLGLDNTRERLRLRYGGGAALELSPRAGGGTEAVLHLPLESSRARAAHTARAA